jgi:hypothetical protein
MSKYTLLFSFGFAPKGAGLKQGRLLLRDTASDSTKAVWTATSSLAGKQYAESFHERGGLIPPAYRLKKGSGGDWRVETVPVPLPNVKGVSGNFYKIVPFEVVTDQNGKRSDFGIHLDANVPGSMGCIVLNKTNFTEFEEKMKSLAKEGIKQVPLVVIYS